MRDTGKTTPLLSAYDWYSHPEADEHAMMCPECGETNGLHINGVELENASRDRHRVDAVGEDGSSRFNVQQDGEANHNGRRHQIALLGWCEICSNRFSLTFRQHKGMTFYSKTVTGRIPEYDDDDM